MLNVEQLALGTSSVPVAHLSAGLQRVEKVEDVCTKGCHSCAPTHIDHLFVRVLDEELTIRSGNGALVPWLQIEDIGGAHTGIHVHPAIFGSVPRRRGDPDVQHDNVPFGRVIRHRIRTELRLIVLHLKVPQSEFVPLSLELIRTCWIVWMRSDVHVLEFDIDLGHVDLNVSTGLEVHAFAFGELDHEFLDKRGDIVIGNHFALPLLDAEDLLRHLDLHIVLHLDLTAQTPVFSDLLACEKTCFSGEDLSSALVDLTFTHAAGSSATTGRRKEDLLV
ncbi:MAG: Uncharacterised protein [Flavobacteriia bacterium]|nr:MAG: Uncharacterised protein [Flavobacteriia bacterium]